MELWRLAKLSDQWQDSHLGELPFIQQAFGEKRQGSHGDKKGTARQKRSNHTYMKGHPTQWEKVDESLESQDDQSVSRTNMATKNPSSEDERTGLWGNLAFVSLSRRRP